MIEFDEVAVRRSMTSLGEAKSQIAWERGHVSRSETEDIILACDFLEWIGAAVAEVYPGQPPPVRPDPMTPQWFLLHGGQPPPLDSMSGTPPLAFVVECRPPLRNNILRSPSYATVSFRRLLGRAIAELCTCQSDIGIATCARVQQLYEAVGGTDPAVLEADAEFRRMNRPTRLNIWGDDENR